MKQETIKKIKDIATIALGIAVYWLVVTAIYLVASFASKAWNLTWITFPCAALIFVVAALVYFNKKANKKFSLVNWIMGTLLLSIGAYLLVSFLTEQWSVTWIIFLVMAIAILVEIVFFLNKGNAKNQLSDSENTGTEE